MADGDSIALVVGASAEELEHVRECLTGWFCAAVNIDGGTDGCSPSGRPELIVLYARKAEKETLAICEELRSASESSEAPILLVISRYQIAQANAVKRMGNAGFIMTPFDGREMRGKIAECFGIS
ncbi:MAG: hypothetical protein SVV80_13570 [Planctomycetota bacterium]|nr:hypothetical protein [Planctomycetota bacterium]